MTPFPPSPRNVAYALIGSALILVAVWGHGYFVGQRKTSQAAVKAETTATQSGGQADAFKIQAQAKDAAVSDAEPRLAEMRRDLVRKTKEMESLRASYAPKGATIPGEPMAARVADLALVVARQDDVIKIQAELITRLDVKIFDLTAARDFWKQSAEAREREAAGLRLALEAQKSLNKGALWKGRLQGFAVGVAGGYMAGRVK